MIRRNAHPRTLQLVTYIGADASGLFRGSDYMLVDWLDNMGGPNGHLGEWRRFLFRSGGGVAAQDDLLLVESVDGVRHIVRTGEISHPNAANPAAVNGVPEYEYKPRPGYSLVLRTSERVGERILSRHDYLRLDRRFEWPQTPGSTVEAPDFTTDPTCGHGLHGLEWGVGLRGYLGSETDANAVFQVVDVAHEDIVRIPRGNDPFSDAPPEASSKVKFRRGTLVYSGDWEAAAKLVAEHTPANAAHLRAINDLSTFKHKYYVMGPSAVGLSSDTPEYSTSVEVSNPSGADLISSELRDSTGYHGIALDIDIPASLVPSSTPGHGHLYIDRRITWGDYKELLLLLARLGVIEDGYAKASIRRGATFLRTPHRPKGLT